MNSSMILAVIWLSLTRVWGKNPYENTGEWANAYPLYCAGTMQSPIEITDENTVFEVNAPQVIWRDDLEPTGTFRMYNDLYAIRVDIEDPRIVLTYENVTYKMNHYKFHWSDFPNAPGSEHIVKGLRYPLEVQFYHYNAIYATYERAVNNPDGILAISILFKEEQSIRETLVGQLLPDNLEMIYNMNTMGRMYAFNVPGAIQNYLNIGEYVRYHGSLTEVPCYETVKWIVYTKPIKVTSKQMAEIRRVRRLDAWPMNYRTLQAVNKRRIIKSFPGTVSKAITIAHVKLTIIIVALMVSFSNM